ncbi:sugar phosphate isomerase/epimerase family protein [Fuscovulum ytuae]|uniref:Sugar phosphate isomerase/epimerase n=1 Tax=Fuscovulum ytuae TaxID=3042299 RepID=A0ABY8Q4A6_9RHOB|nr:sugar phosphate isomerase/epimerase [Fuscovulum sp. YMD61]WGV15032.1 sugar phosphate isomerase/epimerase [Fuscovulum sp. YMD61]
MMALGLGHFTFLHLSPARLVRLAREAGFGLVGLRFHPVVPGQLHWLPVGEELGELRRVMNGEGVRLYDVETVVIDTTLDVHGLVPMMDAAAALGGARINTCADWFDGLDDTFATICDLARARGLGVDLECMAWRGINSPGACLDLIRRSGAPNAGYLVDALHHIRCGGSAADLAATQSGGIVSAQLCDALATPPADREAMIAEARGGRLVPGEGGLPLRSLVAALPQGTTISVEVPSASDPRPERDRAKAIFRATARLVEDTHP